MQHFTGETVYIKSINECMSKCIGIYSINVPICNENSSITDEFNKSQMVLMINSVVVD